MEPHLLLLPFRSERAGRWFLAVATVVLLGAGSWASLLTPYDDAFFAAAAKRLAADGQWLDLRARWGPLDEKPPLPIWLEALSIRALGPTTFAARLPGMIVAAAGIAAAYALLRRRLGHELALLGGLILLTTQQFIHFARRPVTEIYLTVWVLLALLCYAEGWRRRRWLIATGVCAGLAVMTKGLAGLLPWGVIGLHLTAARAWRRAWTPAAAGMLAAAVAVAAPWHLAMLARRGGEFATTYFWRTQLSFLAGTDHVAAWHWTTIGRKVAENYWPWLAALLPAAAAATAVVWRERRGIGAWGRSAATGAPRARERAEDETPEAVWLLLLLCWFGGIVGFFHLTYVKRHQYILPAYPAMAFLAAWGILRWRWRERALAAVTAFVLVALAAAALTPLWPRAMDNNLYGRKLGAVRWLAARPALSGTLLVLDDDPNYCFTCDTAAYYTRLAAWDYDAERLRAVLAGRGTVHVLADDPLLGAVARDLPAGVTAAVAYRDGEVSILRIDPPPVR